MHPQGHSVTHSQVRNHTSDCLQGFCFLFCLLFTAHPQTPWKVYSSACTPQECLFPSQLCALHPSDVGMSLVTTHLKPLYPLKRLLHAIV